MQRMAAIDHVVFDGAAHPLQAYGQIVVCTAQQEPCADCRLGRA
jgi:hypothetical protein